MKYRKVRIAWSAAWGVAAVLLVVLWVRSYYVVDRFVRINASCQVEMVGSNSGTIYFSQRHSSFRSTLYPLPTPWKYDRDGPFPPDAAFEFDNSSDLFVQVPTWLPAMSF